MKKEYIIPKAVVARVNGQENILKDMTLIGGSKGGENMGAKEHTGVFDDSDDDFWTTNPND